MARQEEATRVSLEVPYCWRDEEISGLCDLGELIGIHSEPEHCSLERLVEVWIPIRKQLTEVFLEHDRVEQRSVVDKILVHLENLGVGGEARSPLATA
jgi:hypothetical protein